MKAIHTIFLFFLLVPFVEIYLLLTIGNVIGIMPTVLLVVFTAVLGAWLLRQQGFATFQRFRTGLSLGKIPTYEIIEGPILLVGGALLLTPGFVTDAIGFSCLIPHTRKKLAQYIINNHLINLHSVSPFQNTHKQNSNIIEGEFKKKDD